MQQRARRYMAAVLPQPYLQAKGITAPDLDAAALHDLLERDPKVEVRRRVEAPERMGTLAVGGVSLGGVTVADMTQEHAAALSRQLPQVHIERDRLLTYTAVSQTPRREARHQLVLPVGVDASFTFLVMDTDGKPIPDASILVNGYLWPAQVVTGPDGRGTVTMTGETPESIASVQVKPAGGHWSQLAVRPALKKNGDNLIVLKKLSDTLPDFPDKQVFGWGQQAMQLHRLPPNFRGAGAKIAIVDSGADVDHPDLAGRVNAGVDLSDRKQTGWKVDTVHHGSHCAGIVTGADTGRGIVGFAVEAEVHACKIFPGGRLSDLIEALDYCIDKEIDVINLSLGTKEFSPLVAAKLEEARNAGVACIVAAGNDGGPVNFPGNMPTVLAVAAIGRTDTFPSDSAHADVIRPPQTAEGYFSPAFTCFGPEIDLCAPGVAILSAIPPDEYAAWDGTSMAAPHVTGLAALIVAHHGDFQGQYRTRDARRVERLFDILKSSCTPLNLGDPYRTGAGLPDAMRALAPALNGVAAQSPLDQLTQEMLAAGLLTTFTQDTTAVAALARLYAEMVAAGLIGAGMPVR
ncbi:S8 family serine peptidase [Acrocarpospora macrocephala]|uniref:S8 family serine peptidase n=1 Tax=Acrocarpospora macrocephala TaxID=150177 RepID=UPI0014794704|nr:S8 family serine peptidase [Acrocarpospora macrocephala]